jgi:hypothetical protein
MLSFIRDPKDFWAGVIFLIFGLAAVFIGRDYSMGSAGRMGPAYFPSILGGVLTLIGSVSVVRSMIRSGGAVDKFAVREIILIVLAVLLFGLLVRGLGLAIAVILLVMVSGYASVKFKVGPFLAVALGLAVFAVLVFVKALGLPMPMVGAWLGF